MDCRICQQHLLSYHEGLIRETLRRDLENHLAECQTCRTLSRAAEEIILISGKEKAIHPNPYLSARVMAKIENRLREPEKYLSLNAIRIFPVRLAFAAVLMVFIGFFLGSLPQNGTYRDPLPAEWIIPDDIGLEGIDWYFYGE